MRSRCHSWVHFEHVAAPKPWLNSIATVSITQIWTAFLATLATLAMGVLWVFSHGQGDAMVKSEGDALRAVANASLAALETEINQSPAITAASFARHRPLETIARKASNSRAPGGFANHFRDLAYQGPVGQYPELSMALVDPWGDLLAEAGLANGELKVLGKRSAQQEPGSEATHGQASLTILDGKPFVFSIQSINGSDLRLLSVVPLKAQGDGPIRRTLGTAYPAALVHGSQVVLEFSGSGSVSTLLSTLPQQPTLSSAGISKYEMIGHGADRRLAVWGSLRSNSPQSQVALLVLSAGNAGYSGEGLWARFTGAWSQVPHSTRGVFFLVALWIAALGISIILPRIEWIHPIARLTAALDEPDLRAGNERLAQGPWTGHFEPLLAALGRRVLRNSTQRGWQISGANALTRSSAKIAALHPDPVAVTPKTPRQDLEPTAPSSTSKISA